MLNSLISFFKLNSSENTDDIKLEKKSLEENTEKIFVTWDDVHKQTSVLYEEILKSTTEKQISIDCIVAIAGGGLAPGRIMKTLFNNEIPMESVTLESYSNDNQQKEIQKKQWLSNKFIEQYIVDKVVLVIDELNDTGTTLQYCTEELKKHNPKKIIVGVVDHKEKEKKKVLEDDIIYCYARKVEDKWRVYPWESKNIDEHNNLANKKK